MRNRTLMQNLLFVCSQNKLRSPTAELIFAERPDIAVLSAGLNRSAAQPVTPELLSWADIIFVMEKAHLNRLRKRFRSHLNQQRVICLDIPDIYDFMDPALIEIFETRLPRYIGHSPTAPR